MLLGQQMSDFNEKLFDRFLLKSTKLIWLDKHLCTIDSVADPKSEPKYALILLFPLHQSLWLIDLNTQDVFSATRADDKRWVKGQLYNGGDKHGIIKRFTEML